VGADRALAARVVALVKAGTDPDAALEQAEAERDGMGGVDDEAEDAA
jgi:hypothetical protein